MNIPPVDEHASDIVDTALQAHSVVRGSYLLHLHPSISILGLSKQSEKIILINWDEVDEDTGSDDVILT